MSTFAAIGVYNRADDWVIALVSVAVFYVGIYPLYVLYLRYRYTRRIKRQLVTSAYKLPVTLSPADLAYMFSTRVTKRHIYATVLDLANRSVLHMEKTDGKVIVSTGPKIDSNLTSYEKKYVKHVEESAEGVDFERLAQGDAKHVTSPGEKIIGSKQYVLWWLIRDSLLKRRFIEKNMTAKYVRLLFIFGALIGLGLSVAPLLIVRLIQLLNSGQVEPDRLVQTIQSGATFWGLALLPLIVVSFFLLRFRGWVLGRNWVLTASFQRYLGQIDAFREFVKLTHKGKLRFESKELREHSIAITRPYAIACGFVKKY